MIAPRRLLGLWYGLTAAGGFAFGLLGERRPFGQDMLAHPLVVFYVAVAAGLLIMRIVTARPVPDLISERTLVAGCLFGGGAFLAGNWISAHVLSAAAP